MTDLGTIGMASEGVRSGFVDLQGRLWKATSDCEGGLGRGFERVTRNARINVDLARDNGGVRGGADAVLSHVGAEEEGDGL